MANAGELIIDNKLLKQLDQLDDKLKKLSKTANVTTINVMKLFDNTSITNIENAISKLRTLQNYYESIGNNGERGMKRISNAASKTADAIDKVIRIIQQSQGMNYGAAMKFSSNAQSMNDDVRAIDLLTKARMNLSRAADDYKQKLLEINNAIAAHTQRIKDASMSTQELERIQRASFGGSINFSMFNADTLGRDKEAIGYLIKARDNLKKSDADYEENLRKLNDRIEHHQKVLKDAAMSTKDLELAQRKTYSGAIQFSSNANTIGEEKKAVEYLTKARENLSMTDSKYYAKLSELNTRIRQHKQHIAEASGEVDKFKSANKNLSLSFDGIAAKLGVIFGIDRISAYVGKVVEVTKEFERQKVALDAIIRDQDASHTIWNQTVQLALKSPFQLKELVTYTKQLAAYRIETEKLHDTTKRLADVSAGLGVDMSRLILAYGQIRAATYLRGTELRQLTEAGIPMLEELATYFTELEGRAISAGDVFEMISKRMVTFKDVEEVFKRMTDAGGVFFDMQEKQSQTLYGTISNLKDAYDIMLNEIGQSNYGFTKTFLSFLKDAATNWKEWQFRLIALIPLLSGVRLAQIAETKAIKDFGTITLWGNSAIKKKIGSTLLDISTMTLQEARIYGVSAAQYAAAKATLFFQSVVRGLWVLFKSAAPFLAIAAIIEIVRVMTKAKREAEELRNELSKIATEEANNVDRSAKAYKDLVARLSLANKGSLERKQIINQLNSQYGEYLDFLVDENTSVKQLADSYGLVVERIKNMRKYKAYEKSLETIDSKFANRISEATKDFEDAISGAIGKTEGDGRFNAIIPKRNEIEDILSLLRTEVRKMDADSLKNTGQQVQLLNKVVQQYYGKDVSLRQGFTDIIADNLTGIIEVYSKLQEEEKKAERILNSQIGGSLPSAKARTEEDRIRNDYAQKRKDIESQISDEYEKQKRLNEINIKEQAELIRKKSELGIISKKNAQEQLDALTAWNSGIVKSINDKIQSNLGGQFNEGTLSKVLINKDMAQSQSISEYEKNIKSSWENQKQILDDLTRRKEQGLDVNEKEIKQATELERLYRETANLLGISLNDKKTGVGRKEKYLNNMISLIKELNQKYVELNKTHDKTTAKQKVLESYSKTYSDTIGGNADLSKADFTTPQGIIAMLKSLEPLAIKEGKKAQDALSKAISEVQAKIGVDAITLENEKIKKKFQDYFDAYDLTLKVKDLNIPTDMAERLFGFEAIDLEGLRKKLTESKDLFVGTDMEKEYEKFLGKLDDLENKHIKELAEKYSKYLVQSYSDLGKIRINEMQEIQEIMSMTNIGDKERQLMLKGVQEKTQKEIDKNAWESFKSSAMYEQLFTDIENLGTRSIKNLIKKLGDMKEALKTLPPEVYKEIQGQITKLEETINERNPYESFLKNLSEIRKLNKTKETTDEGVTLKGEDALNYRLMKQQEEIEKTKELISLYEQLRESNGDVSQVKGNTSLLPQEDFSSKTREDWDAIINSQKESLELQEKNAEETGKNADKYAKTRENIGKVKENINAWAEASIKVLDGMDSILDAFGVAEDSSARLWISNIKNIITMTQNIFTLGLAFVSLGIEINSALGVIGIIATALSAIASLFASLFGMKDKRLEKKIKKQEELVQSLEKQYKKLEKQIKQTYDLNTFDMANKQAKENIEEQIKAREEQIRLEQAKKKTDKDKIKEYQEDIEELQEQLQELEEERIQAVGGFGSEESYKEAASEFVSAWLDAYKETGQGLDGLNEKFDEFFMNMIEKQLLYRGVNNYLDGFYKEFDAMFDDNTVTKEELANIREMWANTAPELNDFMEGLVESLGIASLLKGSTGDMEGLQKGIQGVTEETAQIIEGYLNSIRFLVSEKKDMLRDFLNEFKNPNVENPIVSTLKIIAQQTSAINSLLSGILAPHNTLGGQGLKVVI